MFRKNLIVIYILFFTINCYSQGKYEFSFVNRVDVPFGGNAEIVQMNVSAGILAAANSRQGQIDFYHIRSLSSGDIEKLRYASIKPAGEVTSVAMADISPYFVVTAVAHDAAKGSEGRIVISNMSGDSFRELALGCWPDNSAITPDGRWAIIADEAEADSKTPGGVWFIDVQRAVNNYAVSDCVFQLCDLDKLTGFDLGVLEPEFISVAASGRLAAVSCQENDLVIVVDLRGNTPVISSVIPLKYGAEPDGVTVIEPDGPEGDIYIAAAEEGRKEEGQPGRTGQSVSLYMVKADDYNNIRLQFRKLISFFLDDIENDQRVDPEGVASVVFNDEAFLFVGLERLNKVLAINVSKPKEPVLEGVCDTGVRPEGVIALVENDHVVVITADEGYNSPGTISFFNFSQKK